MVAHLTPYLVTRPRIWKSNRGVKTAIAKYYARYESEYGFEHIRICEALSVLYECSRFRKKYPSEKLLLV
jgi:hypothetical protein